MKPSSHRASELALAIGFLAVVAAVPLSQTLLELRRNERVQFTDVFRETPTARNLRQYERTLEEKSWLQQAARPLMQSLLFETFRETGAKAIRGVDGWLFYRPDVRYLLEADRPETDRGDGRWVTPTDGTTRHQTVARAIHRFQRQLRDRGIELLVVPVPGKPSVYPDKVTRRVRDPQAVASPTRAWLTALAREGVPTVDLFEVFQTERQALSAEAPGQELYLATDTHWSPRGAQLAARAVAQRLRALDAKLPGTHVFKTQSVRVRRFGDVVDMTQIAAARNHYAGQSVVCEQVADPSLGPLLPTPSDRPGTYRYPGARSPVLVLGDSFCRIYQWPEPRSLGELESGASTTGAAAAGQGREQSAAESAGGATKKLLPGSAGFLAHLALALRQPVDSIVSDGGASTDVRRRLSMNPEILEGKRVVVWEFVERDLNLGRDGWEDVPLPKQLKGGQR